MLLLLLPASAAPSRPNLLFVMADQLRFDALGYREKSLTVYGPGNMTLVTNASDPQAGSAGQGGHAPQIEDTVYIDRHPQPSSDPTLGKLLQQYHGKLTAELIAQVPNVTLDKPRL